MTDLLAGRVQAGVDTLPNSLPHIQAGALARARGALAEAHAAAAATSRRPRDPCPGLLAPMSRTEGIGKGTPEPIVERLSREVHAGLADADVQKRFAEVGRRACD